MRNSKQPTPDLGTPTFHQIRANQKIEDIKKRYKSPLMRYRAAAKELQFQLGLYSWELVSEDHGQAVDNLYEFLKENTRLYQVQENKKK
jgi:hypothetical protein